jgi:hypothetical protein
MAKYLADSVTEYEGAEDLGGLERLESCNYASLELDGPTPEQNEESQMAVEKEINKIKPYIRLYDFHKHSRINTEHPESADIACMRSGIEKILGYTKLIGVRGAKIPINDAKPERILNVYRDAIARGKSASQKYRHLCF